MMKKCFFGLAACLAVTMFVGCGASQGLIRGQSPVGGPSGYSSQQSYSSHRVVESGEEVFSEDEYCEDCEPKHISKLEYLLGFYWLYDDVPNGSDGNFDDDSYGDGNGFNRDAEEDEAPKYEHNYRVYRPRPDELRYPQQNAPGAVVQYPYYIHKGPDDFFLK